ncbi:hypothetical protein H0V99_01755 [Candidatus Saccharibacteria bacterium]|nr:hypothetical protein [Candidatus Saccharibacteria bacterium]
MKKTILSAFTGLSLLATSGLAVAAIPTRVGASPTERGNFTNYRATLSELNDSNVTGTAQLTFDGKKLSVSIHAEGLEPGMPHPAHIHGKLTGADAMCPANSADTNNDGFVSVFEGAPAYGPIKLNLTSPQTAFGTPPNTVLFAPFAGSPSVSNFPSVGSDGDFDLSQTYTFDMSKSADREAYRQLKALDKQHIVLHGDFAPESVDTPSGSSAIVYDPLLPVACGEISITGSKGKTNVQVKMHNTKTTSHSAHRQ